LQEIRTAWSLNDVMEANAMLDYQSDAKIANQPKK